MLDQLAPAHQRHHDIRQLELRPQAVEQQVKAAVKNFETKLRIHPCWSACAPLSLGDVKAIAELTSETKHERKLGRVDFYNQLFAFHLLGLFKARGSADLPLPFSKLWKIPGASAHTAKDRMFFCLNKGLVKLARPEQPDRNLCRIYHLVYEFREGTRVNSLQEGLQALYDPTVLFRMYSRGIYNRITRC